MNAYVKYGIKGNDIINCQKIWEVASLFYIIENLPPFQNKKKTIYCNLADCLSLFEVVGGFEPP